MNSPEVSENKKFLGVTFIEVILVVALFLTLSILSATFYSRFLLQNTLANATDVVVSVLRKAQMYSMASRQADGWSVHYENNTLTLFKGADFNSRDQSADENYPIGTNIELTGTTTVSFMRITGLPIPADSTIYVYVPGGKTNTIRVNSLGVVNR